MYDRGLKVLPGGVNRVRGFLSPFPIYAESAEGCWITDVDGTRWLDCNNNSLSLIHGHARSEIVDAGRRQLGLGTAMSTPTESEIGLAEMLCERLPNMASIRFFNSGTEAVMFAIKAARAKTGKSKIAKIEGAYHGLYDFAETSLDPAPGQWSNEPTAVPYAKGTPKSVLSEVIVLELNNVESMVRLLRENQSDLAAVLVDVLPLTTGTLSMDPDFLRAIRSLTRDLGIMLIMDEVVSFRFGFGGMQGVYGCDPDLTALGKIIGGGFPVGAVAGTASAMEVFDHRLTGKPLLPASGTFTANPMTMTCGKVAVELYTADECTRLNKLGQDVRDNVDRMIRKLGFEAQTTGYGSVFKIHFNRHPLHNYRDAYPTEDDRKMAAAFTSRMLARNVLVSPYGFVFSTAHRGSDVDILLAAIEEALEACAS